MKTLRKSKWMLGLLAGAVLVLGYSTSAMAGTRRGYVTYRHGPEVVYARPYYAPVVTYYPAPAVVYYDTPAVTYVAPAPVIIERPAYYYRPSLFSLAFGFGWGHGGHHGGHR